MIYAWMLNSPYVEERRQQRADKRWYLALIMTTSAVIGLYFAFKMIETPITAHADERMCQVKA